MSRDDTNAEDERLATQLGRRIDRALASVAVLSTKLSRMFRTQRERRCVVIAPSLLVVAAGLIAQEAEDPKAERETPPAATYYETATVRARALDTATASVQVIDRDDLADLAAGDAAEALRLVPGAFILGNDSSAAVAGVSLRGGDANFTLVLIDGVPVNDSTDQYGGAFPLGSVGAAEVERLEVVRGPLSSFYGSSSLGGAVQLITSAPRSAAPFLGLNADAGSHDHQSGRLSWGRAGESSAGAMGAAVREEQGRVGDDRLEQASLGGRWQRQLGSASAFRLAVRTADWQADDYPDGSGGPLFGSGELRSSDHREYGVAATLDLGGGGRFSQYLRSTWYRHSMERESPAIGFQVPPWTEDTDFRDLRLAWTGTLAPESGASEFSFGAEALTEEGRNTSLLLLPDFFGGPLAGDYAIDRNRVGLFGDWRRSMGNLVAELGVRADVLEGRGAGGGREELSPRFGLRYAPDGGRWSLRASAGRAFKLPSFFALESPRAIGGNPDLDAETSVGADLGFEAGSTDGSFRWGVTAFVNRFEGLIDFDFEAFLNVNRNKVDVEGLEGFLVWRPSTRVMLDVALTAQDTEDRDTGRPLRRRPDLYGGVGLRVDLSEAVRLGLEARHSGGYLDEQIPAPWRTEVAGRTLAGLTLAWRAAGRWRVTMRADNVLDESYETQVGFPGPERSVRIGVRYGY